MFDKESANQKFSRSLKKLRLRFNLLQKHISEIAGITQSVYSSYETGNTHMSLNDADNISRKVWGVGYDQFVSFASKQISLKELPEQTSKAINESKKVKIKEQDGLLAKELDRLIKEGYLNVPITSKQLLAHMHYDLHTRKSIEITNLLNKAPRNKSVTIVGKEAKETLFQLKIYAQK